MMGVELPVIIVGAGVIGLTLGQALKKVVVSIYVIERHD